MALAGMNNEEVATRLRGRAGTSVTLKVRRAVSIVVCSTIYVCFIFHKVTEGFVVYFQVEEYL